MQRLVITAILAIYVFPSMAGAQNLDNDGVLPVYNYHEDEYSEIVYRKDGKYSDEGIAEIRRIFRSRDDASEHAIDIDLIELIDHIQDHFGAETIELISGYRSPAHNRSLRMNGRGTARESLHMQGKAADIHFDEISEEDVFKYAAALAAGGTGIYPEFAFVHIDTGPERTWQEPQAKVRKLVGTENNPNPSWTAVTDKDTYSDGSTVVLKLKNNGYEKQRLTMNVWYERFTKGKWADRKKLARNPSTKLVAMGGEKSYRWKIPSEQRHGKYRLVIFTNRDFNVPPAYSNEFYIKRNAQERG